MLYLLPKTAGRLVFLEYKNDLELENASEEAVALYMRVSNLQKHVNDIVKKNLIMSMKMMFSFISK